MTSRATRTLSALALALGAASVGACSGDHVTAPVVSPPVVAPQFALLPATTQVTALLRTTPLTQAVTRSFTVRRNGGSGKFEWPEMGLLVLVPDRSFSQKQITITVTALAGSVVAYDFGPHGQVFSEPLTIVQSLKGTNYTSALKGLFRGAYFQNATDLNQNAGTAAVSEFQATETDMNGSKVTFMVNHFSGYMVSMD